MKVLEIIEAKKVNDIKYLTLKVEKGFLFTNTETIKLYSYPVAGDSKYGYYNWRILYNNKFIPNDNNLDAIFELAMVEDVKFIK